MSTPPHIYSSAYADRNDGCVGQTTQQIHSNLASADRRQGSREVFMNVSPDVVFGFMYLVLYGLSMFWGV